MTKFSQSRPSQILSIFLLFTLLSGFFALPTHANSPPTSASSSSVSHRVQTPSWLLSLLKDHRDSASNRIPTAGKGAVPMDIKLNESVNIKGQTSSNFLYYSPSEIRSIYNVTSLLNNGINGAGVTIAIVDAYGDPYIQSELNSFSSEFGIPNATVHVICVDGPCNYIEGVYTGWNGEIALDVEWAHAMAPGATINLYIGSNNGLPLYDAVAAAVAGTNGTSPYSPSSIVSMSWGSPENDIGGSASIAPVYGENYPWLNQVFQQGAAEGITFFASTGDWGAYDQSFGQTSPYGGAIYPSTDPFVTAVGGTSLYMSTTSGYLQYPAANATGSYGYETAWSWNNYYGWATGGGFSTIFGQPSWQNGPGVPSGETRGVPDVSWDADPLTGVLVYVEGGFSVYGGTSVGSPSWAGSMALIDQNAGHDLGHITPSIYSIMNNPPEYAKAFHDVTVGNDDPLQAGPGWDPVTGVGTPNIGELAILLAQPSTSLTVLASSNVVLGTSASYTSVQIQATVLSGTEGVTGGTVYAEITSNNGASIGEVTMTYNGTTWTGTYEIQSTDPPGMWTATVYATSGSQSGVGTTTFSVGDGITIFASSESFVVGQTIPITAIVTYPNGSIVSSGTFSATFYLGTPSGTVEGTVPLAYSLTYNSTEMWEGSFTISPSADQGSWVLSISGTDSAGNRAATAYSWLNVGLTAETFTDSPTYMLGDTIQIYSYFSSIYLATTGSYSATVWHNGVDLGTVALSQVYMGYPLWIGAFNISSSDPTGFYRIVVTGNDGYGNSAYGETIVRVASQSLNVATSITVDNTATETLSARIAYPNGTLASIGAVDAFTSYGYYYPMTYNATSEEFAALVPTATVVGSAYSVYVVAFDPWGNTGSSPIQTTSLTTLSCTSSAILGELSTCNATVWGSMPSGEVSWSQVAGSGEVILSSASCTLSSSNFSFSACQVTVIGKTLGSVTLEATYSGDSNNFPSSGTLVITVGTVAVVCAPASAVVGLRTTCTATVVHSLTPVPTGKVTWSASGSGKFSVPTCKLSKGSCKVTYISVIGGTITINASYAGDKYNQASSGAFYLSVSRKTSTTTVSCSPTSVVVGSPKTIRCTVHVTGYLPTGLVYWFANGTGSVSLPWSTTCSLSAKGRCSVTMTATGAGVLTIEAMYMGDAGNTYSSGAAGLLIRQAKTSLSLSCTSTSKDAWNCTATVTGYYPSGTAFWYDVAGSGSVTVTPSSCALSSNQCQVAVTGTSAGKATIQVVYVGDANNIGSQKTKTLRIT